MASFSIPMLRAELSEDSSSESTPVVGGADDTGGRGIGFAMKPVYGFGPLPERYFVAPTRKVKEFQRFGKGEPSGRGGSGLAGATRNDADLESAAFRCSLSGTSGFVSRLGDRFWAASSASFLARRRRLRSLRASFSFSVSTCGSGVPGRAISDGSEARGELGRRLERGASAFSSSIPSWRLVPVVPLQLVEPVRFHLEHRKGECPLIDLAPNRVLQTKAMLHRGMRVHYKE